MSKMTASIRFTAHQPSRGGTARSEGKRQKVKGKSTELPRAGARCDLPVPFILPFSFCLLPLIAEEMIDGTSGDRRYWLYGGHPLQGAAAERRRGRLVELEPGPANEGGGL